MKRPHRSFRARIGWTSARAGFTLMEVIIAMSLVAVLMLLAWSLFSVYTRLEEKGSRLALEQQLARALIRQVQSDMMRLSTPGLGLAKPSHPTRGSTLLPDHTWLVGTSDSLEFLIRLPETRWSQGANLQSSPNMYQVVSYRFTPHPDTLSGIEGTTSRALADSSLPEEDSAARMPTGDGNSPEDNTNQWTPPTGLLRESHWLVPPGSDEGPPVKLHGLQGNENDAISSNLPLQPSMQIDLSLNAREELDVPSEEQRVRDEHDEVAEVSKFRVRYYSRNGWTSSWDSRSSGELPAAVEIVFELDTEPPSEKEKRAKTLDSTEAESSTEEALRQLPTATNADTASDANSLLDDRSDFADGGEGVTIRNDTEDRVRPTRYRTVMGIAAHAREEERAKATVEMPR